MRTDACPIWGTHATFLPRTRDGSTVDSPRAGGRYFVSGSAEAMLETSDSRLQVRLTTWLVDQRSLGDDCPEVHSWTINDARARAALAAVDRADRALRFLASKTQVLGTQLPFRLQSHQPGTDDLGKVYFELLAHSECIDERDLDFLLNDLQRRSLIERYGTNNPEQACTVTVTGYSRLAELKNVQTASIRAFVAMWFDESMDEAWEHGFSVAIRDAGYEPVRIDEKEHVNRIDDEIIAEIRRSRFVVADFTHGTDGARGGVYYEAGFAHGLKIPVIFSCRKQEFESVHFDTRQYNHIVWDTPKDLRERLVNRIAAVVGEGPDRP